MKKLLFFLFLLMNQFKFMYAQQTFECYGIIPASTSLVDPRALNCSYSSQAYQDFYSHKESWYPNSDLPLKYINTAITVRQRTDPTNPGNLVQNDPSHTKFLNDVVAKMNYYLSNNEAPSDPRIPVCGNGCFIQDTRLRINNVAINFTKDDATFSTFSTQNALDPDRLINIFLIGDNSIRCVLGGSAGGGSIFMANVLCSGASVDEVASNFLHEIFHNFNVNHVYANGTCGGISWYGQEISNVNDIDYLSDVFGNTGTHIWETYLYNGCIGTSNVCDPYLNSNDNCTNNFMGSRGKYISPMQAGIIHRNAMMNYYMKDYLCGYSSIPYFIQSDEIWDFPIKFYQDVIIESGNTLVIKCNVEMVPEAKFVVQSGAKLIIDGGNITHANGYNCDVLWRGVELWGNKSTAQYQLPNGYYSQPYIEIKNGGEISYAQDAITTWKTGDYNSSGGIIKCNDAVFKNNLRGIEFIAYQNFNRNFPSFKLPSMCTFENAKFIHDNNLPNNTNPKPFVTAWAVDGIKFNNCTFENINLNATSTAKLGKGIVSLDANFTVTNSKFSELEMGVNAQLGSSSWNYTIDKCKFTNCLGGVFNQAVNKAVLTRNEFILGKPRFGSWFTYGISFNAGTAYRIEENKFDKDAAGNVYSIGTLIQGTGGDMNQVYKNQFNKVDIGNLSSGQNRLANLSGGQFKGLQYFCNNHSLVSNYDIAISGDGKSDGVCNYQGVLSGSGSSVQRSGGNDFSLIGSVAGESDIYNHSPLGIFYFYDNSSPSKYPLAVTNGSKVIRSQGPLNTCASKISSGGGGRPGIGIGGLSGELVTVIQSDFVLHSTAYNQLKSLYVQLLDGGNTENLKQDVNTAWPNETWELRSKLLGKSPYLSEEVLKEANDKEDVLPDAILFEILAANPDCFKDEYFVKYIEEESKRLPDWMLDLLKQMTESNISAKNLLESQIAFHKSEMDFDATILANSILADGVDGNDIDWNAYRSWIGTYQTPWGDYQLVDNYLQTNQIEQASLLLNAIPNLYKLSENERREYDALKGVTTILFKLKSEDRNPFELTTFEKEQLKSISDNGTGTGQVRACNILSFVTGEKMCDFEPNIPRGDNLRKLKTPANKTSAIPTMEITAFPVPAKDYVELYYTLPIGVNEALLRIVDIQGKLMEQKTLKGERGQIALNTANWPTGIYTYTVSTNDKIMTSQKLLIEK